MKNSNWPTNLRRMHVLQSYSITILLRMRILRGLRMRQQSLHRTLSPNSFSFVASPTRSFNPGTPRFLRYLHCGISSKNQKPQSYGRHGIFRVWTIPSNPFSNIKWILQLICCGTFETTGSQKGMKSGLNGPINISRHQL